MFLSRRYITEHMGDVMFYWFEVIGAVLQDLAVLVEHVYSMDEEWAVLLTLLSVIVTMGKW
jgi:hypothetical protein